MIVYDLATKELDTESFPQHTIADLNYGSTFIVLFSQENPLRWKEINTHTEESSNETERLPKTCLTTIKEKRVETKISEALMNFLKALCMKKHAEFYDALD